MSFSRFRWMDEFLTSEANLEKIVREPPGKNLACLCKLCPEHEKTSKPWDVDCAVCWPRHCDFLVEEANRPSSDF
jgi:hypothetical protein